jgi:hypothetical protein
MSVVRTLLGWTLLALSIFGAAFVAWDTSQRGNASTGISNNAVSTTTTPTTGGNTVDRFPIAETKNPFVPLVQLPPTATTQPK